MDNSIINIVDVTWFTNWFCVDFLVDRDRFMQRKLSNIKDNNEEFYMCSVEYKTDKLTIYIADNIDWIFTKFYKMLKKSKIDKIANLVDEDYPELTFEDIAEFKERLINDRIELLKLLKTIRKEYKIIKN
jgi:hypothetical protein